MDGLKNNCTLLVNTCDSYSDCWDGFFKLLKIVEKIVEIVENFIELWKKQWKNRRHCLL